MLAERRPDLRSVHFLHTPFAEPAMLGVLPDDVAAELLDGMAGYVGLRLPLPQVGGRLPRPVTPRRAGRRRRRSSPRSGPTPGCSRRRRRRPSARRRPTALRAEVGGRRIVARADRMEPSKNIVRGMLAFEELLDAHPEWRGEVVHVAFAYPSRQGLAEYLAYAADVEHTAERINHAFGSGRRPTGGRRSCLSVEDDRARSLAALTLSDVLLVNPVRDGLNLVAKEGPLLNTADGVLVLSHEAGAWEELALGGRRGARRQPLRRVGDGRRAARRADDVAGGAGAAGGRAAGGRARRARRPTGGPTSWRRPLAGAAQD